MAISYSDLQGIDFSDVATGERMRPIHPGEILREEFLSPMGLSQSHLALAIGVSPRRIHGIVSKKRAVTADMALRLARYFGTSVEFWTGLQADYDTEYARESLGALLDSIKPYRHLPVANVR